MDEGKLHDRLGKEGDFSNSIVLFTSNVGSEWLTKQLESGNVPATTQIMEVIGQYFRPEFLARLSEIVPFSPIREDILLKIFDIQFNSVRKLLDKQGIGITISDDARRLPIFKNTVYPNILYLIIGEYSRLIHSVRPDPPPDQQCQETAGQARYRYHHQ